MGIWSGPSTWTTDQDGDNEHPELPGSLAKFHHDPGMSVWGDFEVCPLAPDRPDVMQPACVESAKNLVDELRE